MAAFERLQDSITASPLHGFLQDVLRRAAAEEGARQAMLHQLAGCCRAMRRRRRRDAEDKLRLLKELVIRLGDPSRRTPEGVPDFTLVNHWGLRPVQRPQYVPGEWAPLGTPVLCEGEDESQWNAILGPPWQ